MSDYKSTIVLHVHAVTNENLISADRLLYIADVLYSCTMKAVINAAAAAAATRTEMHVCHSWKTMLLFVAR